MRTITKGEYNYLVNCKDKEYNNIMVYKEKLKNDPDNMLFKSKISKGWSIYFRIKYKLDNYNVV